VSNALRILVGIGAALAVTWVALVVALIVARPRGASLPEAVRLLPDCLRLLRRLAADPRVPRSARFRLWLLFAYLALPFDLIPDVVPVLGLADDAVVAVLTLRSVVRRAGGEPVRRHWPGTESGLAALERLAGVRLVAVGQAEDVTQDVGTHREESP
jgi:uncharacterized membrane protein YkvA (DUF1232 family)